ncbi:unnamed protein product, partial [Prorocentrum cordatum]
MAAMDDCRQVVKSSRIRHNMLAGRVPAELQVDCRLSGSQQSGRRGLCVREIRPSGVVRPGAVARQGPLRGGQGVLEQATSIVLFGPRSCLGELRYFTREADLEALGGRQRWSLRRRGDGCRGPVARGKDRGPARGRGRNLRAPHRPRAPRRPAALPAVAQRPGQRPAVEAAGAARHARGVLRLGQGLVPRGARLARGPAARRGAVRGQVPHARRGVVGREDPRERRPGEDLALPGGAPVRHAAVCAPSRPRPPRGAPWRPVIGLRPVAALAARKE